MFTKDELYQLKAAVNEIINSRWTYINSNNTTEEEKCFSKQEMVKDYDLLSKILELIGKEE